MNNSPTPRTDAVLEENTVDPYLTFQAVLKHARQLEREVAELREFVKMVGTYEGNDPKTTDYREIVRDLGRWARELLAKFESAQDSSDRTA